MVTHAEAIVAPDDGGAAGAATSRNPWATFAGFLGSITSTRRKPIVVGGSGGEGADGSDRRVLWET